MGNDEITLSSSFSIKTENGSVYDTFHPEIRCRIDKAIKDLIANKKPLDEGSTTDEAYLKINFTDPNKLSVKVPLTDELKKTIKKWTDVSQKLYDTQKTVAGEFLNEIHKNSESVKTSLETIVPFSDTFAMYRNGYKFALTAVGLILTALAIAGVVNPATLAIIAGVISLVAIAVIIGLVLNGTITDKKEALALAAMTIGSTFGGMLGGKEILLVLYSVSMVVQGFMALGPGGWAYGKGGLDKYHLAKEVGDTKHATNSALNMGYGVQSVITGALWIAYGGLMIASALSAPIPSEAITWVASLLFLGMFNFSFAYLWLVSLYDLKIQEKFQAQITGLLKKQDINNVKNDTCIEILEFLKQKLLGGTNKKSSMKDEEIYNEKGDFSEKFKSRLKKKLLRLQKVTDATTVELLNLENIEALLKQLRTNDDVALAQSKALINDVIQANQRAIKLDNDQIWLGKVGLLVSIPLGLLEELVNKESFIMPYLGDKTHLSKTVCETISNVLTLVDCSWYIYMNKLFRDGVDAPAGRSEAEKTAVKDIKANLERLKQAQANPPAPASA